MTDRAMGWDPRLITIPIPRIEARGFGFAGVVSIVLNSQGWSSDRFIACAGMVKYLQRQKAAPAKALGRGRAGVYSRQDVLVTLFAVELHRAGLTPIQITPIIDQYAADFIACSTSGDALCVSIPTGNGRSLLIIVEPAAIASALEAASVGTDPKGGDACGSVQSSGDAVPAVEQADAHNSLISKGERE